MKEVKALNGVADFHRTFDLPIEKNPLIPSEKRCELRVNLLQEELNEFKQAIVEGDLVEIADALADLQYVLSGAVLEFGLGAHFHDLFEEVQRSNMSKVCKTFEEAQKTLSYYQDRDGTEGYVVEKEEQYLVYRSRDHKVLKSVNYSPADLGKIIAEKVNS